MWGARPADPSGTRPPTPTGTAEAQEVHGARRAREKIGRTEEGARHGGAGQSGEGEHGGDRPQDLGGALGGPHEPAAEAEADPPSHVPHEGGKQ